MREAFYSLLLFAVLMAVAMFLAWLKDPLSATLEGADLTKHQQQKIKSESEIRAKNIGAFVVNEVRNEITMLAGSYTIAEPITFGMSESTKIKNIKYAP